MSHNVDKLLQDCYIDCNFKREPSHGPHSVSIGNSKLGA